MRIARGDRWQRLYVDPGVAIDGLGREIVVPVRSCVDLAAPATSAAVDQPRIAGSGKTTADSLRSGCAIANAVPTISRCWCRIANTRAECAPGTTVETFCFKVTPDWRRYRTIRGGAQRKCDPSGRSRHARRASEPGPAAAAAVSSPLRKLGGRRGWMRFARRYRAAVTRCALRPARPAMYAEGDPCIPLAAILMNDGRPIAHRELPGAAAHLQ